ncbi:MAG: ATP-binding protein [Patescibacteria group bacterium]
MARKTIPNKINKAKQKDSSTKKSGYGVEDIEVLHGVEPVRKRPGMYIGSTGPEGLHHLVLEVVSNAIDEALMGHCNEIGVALLSNNRVLVEDNGRGIPVERHSATKKSGLETIMTTLHAGAKFGGKAYGSTGGLHGVGVSAVCALSSYLKAEVCRDGEKYCQEFSEGKALADIKKIGKCSRTGTTVIFEPDAKIFGDIKFNGKKILNHLRQQAYLTKGVKITLADAREETVKAGGAPMDYTFYFEGGLMAYVKYLSKRNSPRHTTIFYTSGEKNDIRVEAAFLYTKEYECSEESFANSIYTADGGSHLTGFRGALTRVLNDYARKNSYLKEKEDNLTGDDVREGLTAVISVRLQEPQFEGQTKGKLGNPEVKPVVESVVSEALTNYLEQNPQDARAIIENCILSAKARNAAKAARQTVLRKGALEGLSLPGKLADCSSRDPSESELYIVEGQSAGGCFFGETKVALADGRNLSFFELIEEEKKGKKNYCYTIKKDGSIGISPIKYPRKTKSGVEVMKVVLDNGEELICTPDHKFMMRDGSYQEAQALSSQDSLMPLRRKLSQKGGNITIGGYEMVYGLKENKWIFTHLLSDRYNLENGRYAEKDGSDKHHIDFNKLNNNPENIRRMRKEDHWEYHRQMLEFGLHREDVKEKSRMAHQKPEYKEKIRKIMTTPEMRRLLSERAKKQWINEEYKRYMTRKFFEFYQSNPDYREKNSRTLFENQKRYWSNPENKAKQSETGRQYFEKHPEKRAEFSQKAKEQWQNQALLAWRRGKTKEQWTPMFRENRKKAYNQTYLNKAISLLRSIFDLMGVIDVAEYNQQRRVKKDKSILRYETICQRFFNGDENRLKEAVINYNHKIKGIVKLPQKIDVYDLEVEGTHNFALSSGIFVHNSCKMGRDRRFQAILPLRGKILNVERARLDKMLASKEIKSLIIALGTAIAEDFNMEKLRYQRIILTLDADVDGSHIRTLLLTLFYRHFRPLIDKGYLYIAQPPLYKVQSGKNVEYAYNEEDKEEMVAALKKSVSSTPSVQRYKGLGEMNPEELWETTMNPENRVLLQVNVEDTQKADEIFDILMGDEVLPRKKFIQTHAKKVKNLDI